MVEGLLVVGLPIGAVGERLVDAHIVIVRLEQGQRRPRLVGPARFDAAPIGLAEDAMFLAVTETCHISTVEFAVYERTCVVAREVYGLDLLERMQ